VTKVSIDPTAQLSSGLVLRNPSDLRRYLTRRPDQFPTVMTKRLMMYALNRELEYYDMPEVRKIVRDAAPSNYTFAALITGVVNSDAFRYQGAEAKPRRAPGASSLKVAAADSGTAAPQPQE